MEKFRTHGTCSREILFEVNDDGILTSLSFVHGCSGNLQGISKLAVGRPIDEIIELTQGIRCRNNTSCPDQLSIALGEYKKAHNI